MATITTPTVRISITAQPEQVQPDLYVIGTSVQGVVPKALVPILEPMVTFYVECPIRVRCEMAGCRGHYKYGVCEVRNLPVIFSNHRSEIAHYYAFVIKAILPFRLPQQGNELMDGVKWYSISPRDGQIGLTNTCMIDGHVMDLKVRALDIHFCIGCLFVHKTGRGRAIERVLRTIIHYIFMVANPEPSPDGLYQVVQKFTYEQQLYVKRLWVDKIFEPGELRNELHWGTQGSNLFNDMLKDPHNNGRKMKTRMSIYRMVLENLQEVSCYNIKIDCGCGKNRLTPLQCFRYMVVDSPQGAFLYPEPAYLTFNPLTLEFDANYWDAGEFETQHTPDYERNLSKRVAGRNCNRCISRREISDISVPETTWTLIVEVPMYMRNNLQFQNIPLGVVMSGQEFEVSWICFLYGQTHFVSAHYLHGHWYYYDDISGGASSRMCPFKMIDIDNFDFTNHSFQRVFYRRVTETGPHRCIKRACDEELSVIMR